jgi:chromosome segregation ATPase
MARGITEDDVWKAADTLLLEGQRPTIERVRMKIGRGSPNTVSPYLDTWFRSLGGRIKDPQAFAAPPDLPDPIAQAAKHFWEVAMSAAREEAGGLVSKVRSEAEVSVAYAQNEAMLAVGRIESAIQDRDRIAQRLSAAQAELLELQQEIAGERVRLEESRSALTSMAQRLNAQEERETAALAEVKAQLVAAEGRADAADRRVAMELERERLLRTKAERRANAVEATIEKERQTAAAQIALAQQRAAAADERESRMLLELHQARTDVAGVRDQLAHAQRLAESGATALAVAQTEAATFQLAFARLAAATGASTAKSKPSKPVLRQRKEEGSA